VARHVVLLRGINIGSRNRIAMPKLREVLAGEGFEDVQTYVQSGNVVLSSDASADEVARAIERLIANSFGLEIPVVARTRTQLAAVVRRNPLGDVATDPKRYQVSFLADALPKEAAKRLKAVAAAAEPESLVVSGRELFTWHPAGVARSRLWAHIAGKGLGVTATSRNWTTVTTLLEMADG